MLLSILLFTSSVVSLSSFTTPDLPFSILVIQSELRSTVSSFGVQTIVIWSGWVHSWITWKRLHRRSKLKLFAGTAYKFGLNRSIERSVIKRHWCMDGVEATLDDLE